MSMQNINMTNIVNNINQKAYNNKTKGLKQKLDEVNNIENDKELKEACQKFESLFVHMMLKQMRSTIPDNGLTKKSSATKMFEDLYDEELAKDISNNGKGIGLAKMMYKQLKAERKNRL